MTSRSSHAQPSRFLGRFAATPRPRHVAIPRARGRRRGYSEGESRRRRGRDVDVPRAPTGSAAPAGTRDLDDRGHRVQRCVRQETKPCLRVARSVRAYSPKTLRGGRTSSYQQSARRCVVTKAGSRRRRFRHHVLHGRSTLWPRRQCDEPTEIAGRRNIHVAGGRRKAPRFPRPACGLCSYTGKAGSGRTSSSPRGWPTSSSLLGTRGRSRSSSSTRTSWTLRSASSRRLSRL